MLPESTSGILAGIVLSTLPFLILAADPAAESPADLIEPGMRVREAVRRLESLGLRILYNTDIVRARMRVEDAPSSSSPDEVLEEILRPFGLSVRAGPNNVLLIVPGTNTSDADGVTATDRLIDIESQVGSGAADTVLEEILVAASRYELGRNVASSRSVLAGTDIDYAPDIGEDALRAVSRLPGMAGNGVSSRNYVRGGEVGETLVRLDGLRLYEPFHLKDFQSIFSTLDPRVVDSMNVYTGGFPAAFGDRMSGVIDIASISPPESLYHEIGLSFFNSSLLSSGEFHDSRGEWLVSARRSNLELLYQAFSDLPERPRYRDAFMKLSYKLSDKLGISGNLFYSRDDVELAEDIDREEKAQASIDDLYFWLALDHAVTPRLSGRTLISHSNLESTRGGTSAKQGISSGLLHERKSFDIDSLQTDWNAALNDRFSIQFGALADIVQGRYDFRDEVRFELLFDYPGAATQIERHRLIRAAPSGRRYGAYASASFSPTRKISAEFGLRWDAQNIDSLSSTTLSPRIGIRFQIGDRTDFRASLGRFSQSQTINELQVNDGVVNFSKPQRSDNLVLGVEHAFRNRIVLRAEAYQKSMEDLRPRYENLLNSLVLLPELKPDRARIAPSSARARGVEIMLQQESDGPLSWWTAYTYSWVRDRLPEGYTLRSWDQTHAWSAGMNWATPKWNFAADFVRRTGWPVSIAELGGERESLPLAAITARNSERLDYYQSLDIQLTRTIELENGELALTFELVNVFDRDNPCCIEYEIGDEDEEGMLVLKTLDYLPRTPSLGFLWKF